MFNGEPRNTVDWWKQRNLVRQKTGNKSNIQNLIFQMISRGKKLDQVVLGKSGPLLEIQKYHMIKYRYILLSLVCESKIQKCNDLDDFVCSKSSQSVFCIED